MMSVSRLEEKLAETTDPILRKQLQELLEKRKKQEQQIMWIIIVFAFFITIIFVVISLNEIRHREVMTDIQIRKMELDHERELLNMNK